MERGLALLDLARFGVRLGIVSRSRPGALVLNLARRFPFRPGAGAGADQLADPRHAALLNRALEAVEDLFDDAGALQRETGIELHQIRAGFDLAECGPGVLTPPQPISGIAPPARR